MAIYEITADQIRKIPETTYSLAGLRERYDLQRLLRSHFAVISPVYSDHRAPLRQHKQGVAPSREMHRC